jgi:hypothetical protein
MPHPEFPLPHIETQTPSSESTFVEDRHLVITFTTRPMSDMAIFRQQPSLGYNSALRFSRNGGF